MAIQATKSDDPAMLRDLAVAIASEAGDLLRSRLDHTRTEVSTKSTGTDMVTEMDAASETLIVDRIAHHRPDDAVVGEEGAARTGTTGVRWVVDPLDGTTNYLYRLPGWNVSIGVEIDDVAVAGAVVIPSTGEVFAAARGFGATLDGRRIHIADAPTLATSLIGTGFSYEPRVRRRQAENVAAMIADVRDIRRVGAAAADLCSVAAGRLDAYFESGLAEWDRSAGTVIAREAGVRVEHTETHPLPGVLTIAAHPDVWDDLTALLLRCGVLGSTFGEG